MSVELERVGWEDGTLVTPARVNVGGVTYDVTDAEYSGSTPLSAQNLKQMEDNTEDAINGGMEDATYRANSYSTTETRIGTWIDGKPLYRKVVSFGALPNADTKRVEHGISNLGNVINVSGIAKRYIPASQTYSWQPLPLLYAGNSTNFNASLSINPTHISIACDNDRTDFTENYIFIEYTKTTD